MEKTFYSKKTVFNPDYRNVQSELWQLLTDEQQKVVAQHFCHLKNHAQIEISKALMNYLQTDIFPDPRDWSSPLMDLLFVNICMRLHLLPERDTYRPNHKL